MPLCYKDKTFCPFWGLCKQGHGCSRACTEQLAKEAEEFGLPIAVYSEFPECFVAFFEQAQPDCPKCDSNSQVWVNQITNKPTCHRYGCNNLQINEDQK